MKPRRLWVFARDPHGLTAALVREEAEGRVRLIEWQRSEEVSGDAECEDWIAAAIASSQAPAVRDAVVITWQARAAIVQLPLASIQGVKRSEMYEMIGWELESLLPAGEEPRVACAWIEARGGAESASLASGIRVDRLEWWKRVLARHGLRLRGILPDSGATVANTLPKRAGRRAVVEVGRDQLICVVLAGASVTALDTLPLRRDEQPLRVLEEVLAGDQFDEVLISSRREAFDPDKTQADCAGLACSRLDSRCLDESLAGESAGSAAWVAAAARTYWAPAGESATLPLISARADGRESGRRKAIRIAVLALLLFAVGVTAEVWVRRAESSARSNLLAAQKPLNDQRRARGQAKRAGVRTQALRKEAESLRHRAEALRARLERIDSFGPRRHKILPELLDGLASSISAEAVVERLVEKAPGVVCVEGRASSEHAVQRLTKNLAAALRPFDLRVTKQEIRDLGATTRDLPFSYVLILSSAERSDA